MRFKSAVAAAIAIIGATVNTASAVDMYRSKASGSWSSASTWQVWILFHGWVNAHTYPQAGDGVTIRQHDICLAQDAEVAFLTIEHDGTASTDGHTLTVTGRFASWNGLRLEGPSAGQEAPAAIFVEDNGMLKLTGGGEVKMDGQIVLGAGAVLSLENFGHQLAGDGNITGRSSTAKIQIGPGLYVRNKVLIQGALKIEASSDAAIFSNRQHSICEGAIIRANTDGVLELASNLYLDDIAFTFLGMDYLPKYEAIGCPGARLKFSHAEDGFDGPPLWSDFIIDNCATVEFTQKVLTVGCLDWQQGTIIVAPDKYFQWCDSLLEEGSYTEGECD